jgi:hypothetical protein
MDQPLDYQYRAKLIVSKRQPGEEPPDGRFEFETESSSNSLDYYFTHMTRRTLDNFAAEATAGVQLLDSHNNRNLGYGRTFGGRVESVAGLQPAYDTRGREGELAFEPEAEYLRAVLNSFTVRGINFGGGLTYASTDDFIRAVEAGIARDISVGLYGGAWICDICGNNYRSYRDCDHLAGFTYPAGDQGDRQLLSTVAIDGAHLAEHSAVYDGATPGAMVLKAQDMARAGQIEPDQKRLVEVRYQIELPDGRKIVPVPQKVGEAEESPLRAAPEAVDFDNGGQPMDFEAFLGEIRTLLGAKDATAEEALDALRSRFGEDAETVQLAADGRTYRADLVAEALEEGVRALGEGFMIDAYRGMLEQSTIPVIKRMRDDWKRVGDDRFKSGRSTEDLEEREQPATAVPAVVPDAAYK